MTNLQTACRGAIAAICCLSFISAASAQVDQRPMPVEVKPAFAGLKWSGWSAETDSGQVQDFRPIFLTHAGDESNRLFVATQRGVIHAFPNRPDARQTKIFLDLTKQVVYNEKENEEGFLGFAFHPDYKANGQFYVYYTTTDAPHTSVISRFTVSQDDPDKADPASEVEILRVKQPYWNHNGGTIIFGPDGYLYIALGDGGAGNDPHGHGQNLKTLLGSILRIDVDRKQGRANYAIPQDNPFVGRRENARGEIWAYGLRNVWRMAFDPKTDRLWAGDVGQDLWEEIDIIVRGGNYGWNLREGKHKFKNGSGPRKDLIEPIWEYHHDVGKSITGGHVYRGKKLPELEGHYLYADYVTGKIWALKYDEEKKRVVANRPIETPQAKLPIVSFGEDADGETYFMVVTTTGRGIFTFARKSPGS